MAKLSGMPDLGASIMRLSFDALGDEARRCSGCRRAPLAGERLHELESGGALCELCFVALPEERRIAVRSERIGAGQRRLAVVRRAA